VKRQIRVLALDIDGVLTDGFMRLDEDGRETKRLFFRDIDAVYLAHRSGLALALLTGEETKIVDRIAERLAVDRVYRDRDKERSLTKLADDLGVTPEEVCYVGDAPRDAPALRLAGLGLAPADAAPEAHEAADRVLASPGGRGAVSEAVALVLDARGEP
jgi:YrbI family 3-deoxy-D-manno-octulosonate 8-phosphate phosphatase